MNKVQEKFVYLHRLSHTNATEIPSVMQSVSGIFNAPSGCNIQAECKSRALPIMGLAVAFEDLDNGQVAPRFSCAAKSKTQTKMKRNHKTAGETAPQGFIWLNRWSDAISDLTDEQLGRLLRAIWVFIEEGVYVDLNDDQALKMAYGFICFEIKEEGLLV